MTGQGLHYATRYKAYVASQVPPWGGQPDADEPVVQATPQRKLQLGEWSVSSSDVMCDTLGRGAWVGGGLDSKRPRDGSDMPCMTPMCDSKV